MKRVVLDKFDFILFAGIGFINTTTNRPILKHTTTYKPRFEFCFPLMIERCDEIETLKFMRNN